MLRIAGLVPGLESDAGGLTMSFNKQPSEFAQILNTGNVHWWTASAVGVPHLVNCCQLHISLLYTASNYILPTNALLYLLIAKAATKIIKQKL